MNYHDEYVYNPEPQLFGEWTYGKAKTTEDGEWKTGKIDARRCRAIPKLKTEDGKIWAIDTTTIISLPLPKQINKETQQ